MEDHLFLDLFSASLWDLVSDFVWEKETGRKEGMKEARKEGKKEGWKEARKEP